MSSTIINVETTEIKQDCDVVEMYLPYILLALDCTVFVYFKGADGQTKKVESVYINPTEYALWETEDSYIIDLVLSKLGLTQRVV